MLVRADGSTTSKENVPMIHRPSLRATVTTLAAAAVLVGGAQLTSYAATGHPLLIGKSNSGVGTTTLKNAGHWLHADNPAGFIDLVEAFLAATA